jgi:succinoglycan biosynthesis protein ExoV
MDLFYCRIEGGNFGDDMNAWFWDALMPGWRDLRPGHTLFGIGSILGRSFLAPFERVLVLGSGSGYGPLPDDLRTAIDYGWVRGPLTAQNLGLPEDRAITDPACMVPTLPEFRTVEKTGGCLFIPHCGTERLGLDWRRIAESAGMEHLSPAQDSKAVIRRIAGAELVVTESLHGAIVADAFRVPWVPIAISPTFSSYKWTDWARSLELEIAIAPALARPKALYRLARSWRARLLGRRARGAAEGESVVRVGAARLPRGALQDRSHEYRMRDEDKTLVRGTIGLVRRPLEAMLAADLRRARAVRPNLSDEAVLARRQAQILDRLEAVRVAA